VPFLDAKSSIKLLILSATSGSRLAVGSSKRSISGSLINALARETLFFCPEESSPVFLFLNSNKFNCSLNLKFCLVSYLHRIIFHKL